MPFANISYEVADQIKIAFISNQLFSVRYL